MNLRLTIFFVFITFLAHTQSDYAAKADSFLQDLKLDSTLHYLSKISDQDQPGVQFRTQFLAILTSDQTDEEIMHAIENHVDEYEYEDFSDMVRVTYLSYFCENMIPDDSKNAYNLEIINKSIDIYEKSEEKDSFLIMHLLHNKGSLLYELGRSLESIASFEKALQIAERIDTRNESFVGIICYNLAYSLGDIGQFNKSYQLIERSAVELSQLESPNLDYYKNIYLELVSQSLHFGYLEKAENYLTKAENIYQSNLIAFNGGRQAAMDKNEITHLYKRMQLYNHTANVDGSIAVMQEAEQKFKNHSDYYFKLRLATIYNYMGEAYVKDEAEKSFQYYEKAIQVFNNKEDLNYGLMFEFNLGKAYLNSKNYSEAAAIASNIIEKGRSIDDPRLPFFYFLQAKIDLETDHFEKSSVFLNEMVNALNTGDQPIDLLSQEGVYDFIPSERLNEGYLISDAAIQIEDDIANSEESIRVANSLYNLAISNFKANFKRAKFSEKSRVEYEKMLSGLIRSDQYLNKQSLSNAELIRFSENASSRNLWEKFKFKNEQLELVSNDLLMKEQELRSEITALKLKMDSEDSTAIKLSVFEKELVLESLELEKRNRFTSFYRFEDYDFDFSAFQSTLTPDQMVLKYEFLDSLLFIYEITSERIEISALDSFHHVEAMTHQFTELLRDPSSDVSEIQHLGEKLGKSLLPDQLSPELIVVADRVLNYLPFDLLFRNGKYLLSDFIISNVTSLALLQNTPDAQEINSSIIVAPSYDEYILNEQQLAVRGSAYNLEGALAEADAISGIISSSKWSKEDANKQTFLRQAKEYDLLHLSMHSFMNDEDPELSSLVFSDSDEDNELFISELYGMNLNAKLAVLSACNTGVGKVVTGEGMVSVNQAFTYAGVPSVVSSLWSAPDQATKELMTELYTNLKKGNDKASALRKAKIKYLEKQSVESLRHPFFWGSFVLHGSTESLNFGGSDIGGKTLFLLSGLLLMVGALWAYKKWS